MVFPRLASISRSAALLSLALLLAGCVRPNPGASPFEALATTPPPSGANAAAREGQTPATARLGTPVPAYIGQPTPDAAHYEIDTAGGATLGTHTVAVGETLSLLAQQYGTTVEELMSLNEIADPDLLHAGQALQVPGGGIRQVVGPEFKIIPDSELVYGPAARDFDARAFVTGLNGYLLRHSEEVEGQMMDGPTILQLVADRHSINPRLLLAVLEYRTGWVSNESPPSTTPDMGYSDAGASGLYRQLSWAANLLNTGFYGRAEGGLRGFNLGDDTQVTFSPAINHGTAGAHRYLGAIEGLSYEAWLQAAGADGLYATFERLFGNPFAYTFEPILPVILESPPLELPWTAGETWYYTGGPHGAWNSGSAWGALDFVPPAEQVGCIPSDAWVTAMADGVVVRSGNGAVVVDLDGDSYAGTGWAITYMHLEGRDRIAIGTNVKTGDRLGHPSCEGGFSNGTHLHITRSYNGRWISADGDLPFVMSGWVSSGTGTEYDGYLTRGEAVRGACVCREEINAVSR